MRGEGGMYEPPVSSIDAPPPPSPDSRMKHSKLFVEGSLSWGL